MSFDWTNPYPSIRIPLFARNVVSTSHPLAAQAGLRMLLSGGNAVDAIIAAAAMLTIVEPVSCGLGSDAFAILWDGKTLHGLNASGPAPASWTLDYFRKKYGEDGSGHVRLPQRGWDAVTVPGAVAAWAALHHRFGKLPFADLVEPAAVIAERGVTLAPVVSHKWNAAIPEMRDQPGFAEAFMPGWPAPPNRREVSFSKMRRGRSGQSGRRTVEPCIEGEIAERIAAFSRETGGTLQIDDLRAYEPFWLDTISKNYCGYDVHELPPNGQGIAALIALGILKHFDISSMAVDSAGIDAHPD